jgi:hypothetical protein
MLIILTPKGFLSERPQTLSSQNRARQDIHSFNAGFCRTLLGNNI